jgi:hypothetical protein
MFSFGNSKRMESPFMHLPTLTANLQQNNAFSNVDLPDDCKPNIEITKTRNPGFKLLTWLQIADSQEPVIEDESPSKSSMA